jgi:Fe2+ transport system protein FeoA
MTYDINTLNKIKSGMTVKVRGIRGGKNARNRLMEMGIIEGASIHVVTNSGGPLIILVGNSRFAIGRGIAQKIIVNNLRHDVSRN